MEIQLPLRIWEKKTDNLLSVTYDYIDPHRAYTHIKAVLEQEIERDNIIIVGASLGGFWANYFAQKFNRPCVLINPAIYPWQSLNKYIGVNINYNTGKERFLTPDNVDAYRKYETPISQTPRSVILGTEDKIIDYRIAEKLFKETSKIVLVKAGHRLRNFTLIAEHIIEASKK